ncbi:DNAJ heat shock N-terminal domain-containing protein, partial [Prunus dulcis]
YSRPALPFYIKPLSEYPFYPSPSVKFVLCPLKYCHYSLNPGSCKTLVNPTARADWISSRFTTFPENVLPPPNQRRKPAPSAGTVVPRLKRCRFCCVHLVGRESMTLWWTIWRESIKTGRKKVHPDLVHTKSKEEREYAAEQSARVIDAYLTLSKPLARAIYILKLEGVDVDEEETLSESELLTEILEIREAVEEAADSQALVQIQSQMQEKLKHWSSSFANAFQSRNFDEALKAIRRMTYYQRVKETIVKKL